MVPAEQFGSSNTGAGVEQLICVQEDLQTLKTLLWHHAGKTASFHREIKYVPHTFIHFLIPD